MTATRAVVLARGLGTRMRTVDPDAPLTLDQARAADAGLKALMPVNGRPFLDYVLSSLADAGITDVGLVVAPDHQALRRHYVTESPPSRLRVSFVVQDEPVGTADAVVAVERWANGEPFLVMNADNLYPVRALADLVALDEPGLPAFARDDLVRSSNIPPERLRSFAVIDVDEAGYLIGIVEKPVEGILPPEGGSHTSREGEGGSHRPNTTPVASAFRRKGHDTLISMNCWRVDSRIFAPCRDVPRSPRGEFELPEAVGVAVSRGVRFRALGARGPVLDLSRRGDTPEVARRLAGVVPRP
jgi:glucose-1-phosphate thymidylyltransferase